MNIIKLISVALLACTLAACANTPMQPKTVTIVKSVPAYPPDTLFAAAGGCNHAPAHAAGSVRDLANALIDERSAVSVCLGDRAALRQWEQQNKAAK